MQMRASVIAVGLVFAAFLGCERAKAPINGLGGFSLGKTTLGSVQSQIFTCNQQDQGTRCWINARQSIMGRVPQIELDFAGHTPDALLAEILLEMPGCQVDKLTEWFTERMGKPTESGAKGAIWEQKYIVVRIAVKGPSRCHITAVNPADSTRVERLKT